MAGKHRKPTRGTSRILTASVLGAVVAAAVVVAVDRPAPAAAVAAPAVPDWDRQAWLSMALVVPVSQWAELPQPPSGRAKPARQQPKRRPTPAAVEAEHKPKRIRFSSGDKNATRACAAQLDGTRPHVARAGHHLAHRFDVATVYGRHGRAGPSDHPAGLALDFMVDRATGDQLADYVLAHRDDLAVTYVIWRQRINDGAGWRRMEDRGNDTANHYDHVHVSFETEGGDGLPC